MMKLKYKFVVRKIFDEYAAVPVGKGASAFHGMLNFNDIGKVVFEQLQNGCTMEDIVEALKAQYEGEEADMRRDAEEFVAQLRQAELLTED